MPLCSTYHNYPQLNRHQLELLGYLTCMPVKGTLICLLSFRSILSGALLTCIYLLFYFLISFTGFGENVRNDTMTPTCSA